MTSIIPGVAAFFNGGNFTKIGFSCLKTASKLPFLGYEVFSVTKKCCFHTGFLITQMAANEPA